MVIAVAHEGGACQSFAEPDALESCDAGSEIFALATKLPKGSVDAIVAGHTHQGVAQRVNGIPIIQAFANGRAFGRVDLTVDRATGQVLGVHIDPPRDICAAGRSEQCQPGLYLDRPVARDEAVAAVLEPALAAARQKGEDRLGVDVTSPLPHNRSQETALGNLMTDLMRAPSPGHAGAQVALLNGGGMRTGFLAGPLTYGRLYEAFPFDNALAFAEVRAATLADLLARSLSRSGSLLSISGLSVRARCQGKSVAVALTRPDGSELPDDARLRLVTTDFLATGGDGIFAGAGLSFTLGAPLRDHLATTLHERGGQVIPQQLFDPEHPRFQLPGPLPLRCQP